MAGMQEFYLVTTSHLENRLWFRDNEDFKVGMNVVALISSILRVNVLAFVLMSNHVHFVLQCSREMAEHFITSIKNQYSRFYAKKYQCTELLRRNEVDIRRVCQEDESLERAIAYVQVNPVAANICLSPSAYPWGSGNCFFQVVPEKGVPVESLSRRKCIALFHSRQVAPPGLVLNPDGYITPSSFVKTQWVEGLFRTPKRMNYFLGSSSKARRRLESENDVPAFRDQIVASGMGDLCQSLFQSQSIEQLPEDQQSELLKQIRYRFSSNIHQMVRVSGLPYETVANLLDKM